MILTLYNYLLLSCTYLLILLYPFFLNTFTRLYVIKEEETWAVRKDWTANLFFSDMTLT